MAADKSYFSLQTTALWIGGISLKEPRSTPYQIFSMLLLTFVCSYPFLGLIDVFKQDFETVADLMKYEFATFIGMLKILITTFKRTKLVQLLDKLEKKSLLSKLGQQDERERELMDQCSFIVRTQSVALWAVTIVAFSFDVLYSAAKRIRSSDYNDWQFPFGTFTLFNVTHSPNFELSLAYQSISMGCICITYITIDSLTVAIICHICFRLRILQRLLRNIVENSRKAMEEEIEYNVCLKDNTHQNAENCDVKWKYLHRSLQRAVEYHLAIIDAVGDLNEVFGVLFLMVFLGMLGMLAILVYTTSLVSMESCSFPFSDIRVITGLGEMTVIACQVIVVCYWGEQMIFEGTEVGTAAYKANFVGCDDRFQKGLVLVIRRSQTPLMLDAAGLVSINLSTFLWMIRSTYSTFMVLRKHNVKD